MYTIKGLAQEVLLPISTIRYYERVGLIQPKRSENNYRCFDEVDSLKIKYIKVMKHAGFSIDEMKQFIQLLDVPSTPNCSLLSDQLITEKERQITQRIKQDQLLLGLLNSLKPNIIAANYAENEKALVQQVTAIYQDIEEEEERIK